MEATLIRNPQQHLIYVTAGEVQLEGNLVIPENATGIVLFAHSNDSSCHTPCNRYVANVLQQAGLATLLLDLLTSEEAEIDMRTRHFRFDIKLLASRLVATTDWLRKNPDTKHLKIGYFGASIGGGAALVAAAERPEIVKAIVSRSGKHDVADAALPLVKAPTLLIVGEYDIPIIVMNEDVIAQLRSPKQLKIIPQATHLFEESDSLAAVTQLASQWFTHHFAHSVQSNTKK